MVKRARGSVRPGQRRPIDRRPATPAAAPAHCRVRHAQAERPERRGARPRRRARGPAPRRGARGRDRPQADRRACPDPRGGAAVARWPMEDEYAYVARDVKDIVRIAVDPARDPVRAVPDHRRLRRGEDRVDRAGLPSPHAHPARRPRRPPRSPVPAAARAPAARGADAPADARGVRRPGAPRRRARARCAGASPAATSRRSSCGARPARARRPRAAPRARPSAPSSRRCQRRDVRRRRGARDDRRGAGAARARAATRTVLFIDEIHRFNKAQQDALLPHVEDGTVTLIGATTENPYFEVNSALLSRLRVWRLEPLDRRGRRASSSGARSRTRSAASRGRSGRRAASRSRRTPFEHLVDLAGGDARAGAQRARGRGRARRGRGPPRRRAASPPRLADVEAAAQQRVLAYDRAGDGHYDTVSARSSRASAATTPTPRCTGWRR